MSAFLRTIARNWHFMRVLRVALSLIILIQAWYANDITTALIGVMLLLMGLFNIGCCGAGGCYTSVRKKENISQKEPVYEEVV